MVTPAVIDAQRVDEVVSALCDRVGGEWLLVGGALVAMWLEPRRVTEDIDLVSTRDDPAARLALMQLASDLGLPIEAVNSAADFFVRRIPGWDTEIETFRVGAKGRVFRPTPTLFLLLKLARLSATDLDDCLALLDRARQDALQIDVPRVLAALDASPSVDAEGRARRATLRVAMTTFT